MIESDGHLPESCAARQRVLVSIEAHLLPSALPNFPSDERPRALAKLSNQPASEIELRTSCGCKWDCDF